MGSLQVSNGGVLGTSCMQKQAYGHVHGPCYLTMEVSLPRAYSARSSYPLAGEEPRSARDYRYYSCDDHRAPM